MLPQVRRPWAWPKALGGDVRKLGRAGREEAWGHCLEAVGVHSRPPLMGSYIREPYNM